MAISISPAKSVSVVILQQTRITDIFEADLETKTIRIDQTIAFVYGFVRCL